MKGQEMQIIGVLLVLLGAGIIVFTAWVALYSMFRFFSLPFESARFRYHRYGRTGLRLFWFAMGTGIVTLSLGLIMKLGMVTGILSLLVLGIVLMLLGIVAPKRVIKIFWHPRE